MDKKKREKAKNRMTNMQEFLYAKDFKKADRAAGYTNRHST
ncbi:MAG: YfhE family protein [Bacillus sp. (in: firmicutes)]